MHPSSRAERRAQRDRIIARRRFVWQYIWRSDRIDKDWHPEWGRYAKWNMNCGCTRCHSEKYFNIKSRRRYLRDHAESTAECRTGDRKVS